MNEYEFQAFYDRTSRSLWAYLVRVSGNRDAASDLVQEAFTRFLAADTPAMDDAQSKSYLFRIATNLFHERWRRERWNIQLDEAESGEVSPGNLETVVGVRQAFERLNSRERELLWLAYVEGSRHHEIANITGLKLASVGALLFRARQKLARALRGALQNVEEKQR
jgi:RNA polymerase sigma-70 factor, ECF subfamily